MASCFCLFAIFDLSRGMCDLHVFFYFEIVFLEQIVFRFLLGILGVIDSNGINNFHHHKVQGKPSNCPFRV